jgi:cytochrome b561
MRKYIKAKRLGFFIGLLIIDAPIFYIVFNNAHWSVGILLLVLYLKERATQWQEINSPITSLTELFSNAPSKR